jgi:outer membrane protein OmpA-like peptidoglycan-associated protein
LGTITSRAAASEVYPSGTVDNAEPSGEAPPSADALSGYVQSYVNDFTGTSLPHGWDVFTGAPQGDPDGQWASDHVVVSGGMLQLNTWQDPSYNNEWVSGGICQCGLAQTYGAYFVRSRVTGPGPTQVESLWPAVGWPPEVDFDETYGGDTQSMATLHFTTANQQIHQTVDMDMTQWHTWGVIWTPTSVTYTVDGQVWGSVAGASEMPHQPMTLDIQQQTWCSSNFACPTSAESTDVDWVAEYVPTVDDSAISTSSAPVEQDPVTVRSFAPHSRALSSVLKAQIVNLARKIRTHDYSNVVLVGSCDSSERGSKALAISKGRAVEVDRYLKKQLTILKVTGVRITTIGDGTGIPVASNSTPSGRALNRRVVATIS